MALSPSMLSKPDLWAANRGSHVGSENSGDALPLGKEMEICCLLRSMHGGRAGQHSMLSGRSQAPLTPSPDPVIYPLVFVTSSGPACWERSNLTRLYDTQFWPFSSLMPLKEGPSWLWSFYALVNSNTQFSLKYPCMFKNLFLSKYQWHDFECFELLYLFGQASSPCSKLLY